MTPEVEKRRLDDFCWFVENYDNIYKQYGECYVAVRNKEIIGVFSNFGDACHEMDKVSKSTDQIIQYCNGKESGYRARFDGISPVK